MTMFIHFAKVISKTMFTMTTLLDELITTVCNRTTVPDKKPETSFKEVRKKMDCNHELFYEIVSKCFYSFDHQLQ